MNPATRAAVVAARRRPRRLLLTGLAVLVATVFAAGSVLLTATLRDELVSGASAVPAGAAFTVDPGTTGGTDATGGTDGTDPGDDGTAALAERLRAVSGVTAVSVTRSGLVPVVAGGASGSWSVGTDPMSGPLSTLPPPTAGRLPSGPGEALVGVGTAQRTGLGPGAELRIGDRVLTVTGVGEVRSEFGDALVLADDDPVATAGGLYASRITVAGSPERSALTAVPGVGGVRSADEQRAEDLASASASATSLLAGLSVFVGLSLVAAAVVVSSTFRIVLARRARELALLRCVGAGRAQVVRSVLAEASLTGLVAGVGGVLVAVAGGAALVAVGDLTGAFAVPALSLPWPRLAGCVLLAVVVTVLAALAPAAAAGRTPPVVALGAADATGARAPRARVRVPVAAVAVAFALLAAFAGAEVGDPLVGTGLTALSGMLVFAALVAVGPFLVSGVAALLAPLVARWGPGRVAVANARRMSRRTAAMTTVLSLGVGLTAALLVGVAGASADARESIERNYPAEVVVFAGGPGQDVSALVARLDADPLLTARTGEPGVVLVDPVPGADPVAVRTAVVTAVGPDGSVTFVDTVREQTESALGAARAIGLGLVGTTLLVAVVGVGVTLALSVNERSREIALLRTLGLSRTGARRSVAAEAGLAGVVSAVLGVVLGGLYGVLALGTADIAAGTSPGALPLGQLAGLAAGVVAVAVAASIGPMRRAGRIEPAHGVATT